MIHIFIQLIQSNKSDSVSWYSELWSYFISSEVSKTLFFWIVIVILLYTIKFLSSFISQKPSISQEYIVHNKKLAEDLVTELNKPQNTCIMLKGNWGSGKTSFYQKQIQPTLHTPVFLSCINYNDVDSLKIDIINYSKPLLKFITPIKILCLVFGDDFLMPRNRIIVLDDFERTIKHDDFNIDRLINILIMLKDKHHNSLLLLCNDKEVIDYSNFIKYREKLIGKIIRLPVLGINELEIYKNLANRLIDPDHKYQLILDNINRIYVLESNIRLIIQLIKSINDMLKLDVDEVKFNIRLLIETDLIYFMYAYLARGEDYQELLDEFDIIKTNNNSLKYDLEEIKDSLESFDYEFKNILQIDYLKLELDGLLHSFNFNRSEFETKGLEYLNKFISKKTKNSFNLDYVLYLLFVVWTAKIDKYQDYFDEILSSNEFMNQDTFKPVRDVVGIMNPLFRLYDQEQYYQIFGIVSDVVTNDISKFEVAYCLFYRNKVINKFIGSINQVLWDEVNLFADGWFIRCCNNEDQNVLFILSEDINIVAELYVKSNKYLNLNIIQKWIGNKVELNTLLEYYAKVLEEFEIEKTREDNQTVLLDWLLSEKIKSVKIRKKFTKLNEMIKNYANSENCNTKYNLLIQEHIDLINKLEITEGNDNYSKKI